MSEPRRWIHRWDIGFILFFCLCALILWYAFSTSSSSAGYASVYQHQQLIGQIALDTDGIISFEDCPNVTFEVKDGAVRFYSSDCMDYTCIRTGFLSHPGQSAVCLPNEIVLVMEGEDADAPDIIIH